MAQRRYSDEDSLLVLSEIGVHWHDGFMLSARQVLDRAGLVKKEQVKVTANTGGMFILTPKTGI